MADSTEGITATVIGILYGSFNLTTTSTNPDDSEPTNCAEVNSTTVTSNKNF